MPPSLHCQVYTAKLCNQEPTGTRELGMPQRKKSSLGREKIQKKASGCRINNGIPNYIDRQGWMRDSNNSNSRGISNYTDRQGWMRDTDNSNSRGISNYTDRQGWMRDTDNSRGISNYTDRQGWKRDTDNSSTEEYPITLTGKAG